MLGDRLHLRTLLAIIIVAGCKGTETSAPTVTTATAATAPVGAPSVPALPPPMPKTLPDPAACAHDTDCDVALALDGTGCCDQNFATPMSKAFRSAVEAWRTTSCAGYVCPTQNVPGPQPAACFFEPRCVSRRCTNACSPAGASSIF